MAWLRRLCRWGWTKARRRPDPLIEVPIKGSPDIRAAILLQSMMTKEQKLSWTFRGYLIEPLRGDLDGCGVWITQEAQCWLVDSSGHARARYCVGPEWDWNVPINWGVPLNDTIVTYLVWIRFDPKHWKKTANLRSVL